MTSKSGYSSTLLRRKASAAIIYLARLLILTIVGYIVLYPFFYMLVTAIKDIDAMLDVEHIWIPVTYSLKSFKEIFELLNFGTALKQTFLVQILSAAIETFVCAFVAYGFARFKFKGKPICMFFLILSLLVPIQMYSLSMSVNYRNLHLFNTPFVYWLPSLLGVGIRSGMMIFIYQQFFVNLPKELEDAAYIDGAGPVRTYFSIALPSSSVVLVTVSVLSFVWHWNENYLTKFVLNQERTLSYLVSNATTLISNTGSNVKIAQAIIQSCSLILLLPTLILFFILQRHLREGIARSGIVG